MGSKTMPINFHKGIQRVEIVLITILFMFASFSSDNFFWIKFFPILPELFQWSMVAIYNIIVVDFFSNIGLDSKFWWGLGRGLTTAFFIGLFFYLIKKVIKWVYAGFIK
jgi:hypothetical protein